MKILMIYLFLSVKDTAIMIFVLGNDEMEGAMFGYVTILKPELRVKEFYRYNAYYCGLCHVLKKKYGRLGQATLTYDMTFLIILLTSLYQCPTGEEEHRCLVHPAKKHKMLVDEMTQYAADMNIVLSYYHFKDDWQDEKSIAGLAGAGLLKGKHRKIYQKYQRQCEAIGECMEQLSLYEAKGETDLDQVSGCFGRLMGELFLFRKDGWESGLRKTGFFLGKFIYLMDAYEDMEKDEKQGSYNPLSALCKRESFEADIEGMLRMMMSECAVEFEKLPCIQDSEILRNILYDGVWNKYNMIRKKRGKNDK